MELVLDQAMLEAESRFQELRTWSPHPRIDCAGLATSKSHAEDPARWVSFADWLDARLRRALILLPDLRRNPSATHQAMRILYAFKALRPQAQM